MTTLFRFLQFFTLGAWIGSILYFGAIVAPAAFTVFSNADQVGALVGGWAVAGVGFTAVGRRRVVGRRLDLAAITLGYGQGYCLSPPRGPVRGPARQTTPVRRGSAVR